MVGRYILTDVSPILRDASILPIQGYTKEFPDDGMWCTVLVHDKWKAKVNSTAY